MVHGGCLCGGVRYEISGELDKMHFCHCQMCRRAHGTPFSNYVALNPRDRRYTRGEELIARYQSSAEAVRTFCSRCGSKLEFQTTKTPDEIWIVSGTFDDDPGIRSTSHIYVASKAPWFEITDDLKQYPEEPD
ncbi:MAG: GFA family protein [Myxococcales bacterium]|nr:GFA family protein [Myxococcales bacterium]